MRFLAVRLPSLNGVSRGSVAPEVEVKVLLQLEMDTVVFLEHLGHPFGKIEQNRYNGYRPRGNWCLSARTGRTAIRLADSCSVAGAFFNHQNLRRIFYDTNEPLNCPRRPPRGRAKNQRLQSCRGRGPTARGRRGSVSNHLPLA